jgi:hypothetical protein
MTATQGATRRNFGTTCPEVSGFGELPNKHFYDIPVRENHKNFKCVYTLELLAVPRNLEECPINHSFRYQIAFAFSQT